MNTDNSLNISFEDLFRLLMGLIADDLKVQRHLYHLSLSGLDTTPLQLDLHRSIFILAGFKEATISEELEEWYFEQTLRVNDAELVPDEQALTHLSAEILEGLLKRRNEVYGRKMAN
ncbi:hypothetical protein [Fluviicola chungangensis]|uniref:Uncharacterized protein n=1 Tax=Fluviicola chungangensis TaxID=2597671 RepID=A0A556N3Q5_9FLAO|nr:hypothetical protein [Fluviicola chungangensis]TSJ46725.1 hypothetical protein FO442_06070 [Fluviicola chungangensis]